MALSHANTTESNPNAALACPRKALLVKQASSVAFDSRPLPGYRTLMDGKSADGLSRARIHVSKPGLGDSMVILALRSGEPTGLAGVVTRVRRALGLPTQVNRFAAEQARVAGRIASHLQAKLVFAGGWIPEPFNAAA